MRRLLAWLTVLLLVGFGAQSAAADPLGQVTEFGASSGLPADGFPRAIAPGPDGSLWFADDGTTTKAIGRIVPSTGHIDEFLLGSGSKPYSIAVGSDNNMWFTDNGTTTKAIGRINPFTGHIDEFTLPSGSSPRGIAAGADGKLWFADAGSTPQIGRIDPTTGHIDFFGASNGLLSGSVPGGLITPGADRSLWFTDQGTTKAVGRITLSGQITEYPTGARVPAWIAPGPDGNLWFTSGAPFLGGTVEIGLIDPATGQITDHPIPPPSRPIQIVTGPDGNLWFTDHATATSSFIRQMTTSGAILNSFTGGFGNAVWMAPGSDGNLWFGDQGTTKAIGRIGGGVMPALQTGPSVSGSGRAGDPQTCQNALWTAWAGVTPSLSLIPSDGTRWFRDGAPVASGQSFTPRAGDVGHQLACQQIVTYPTPLLVTTTPATSAAVVVKSPQLLGLSVSPKKFSLAGRLAKGRCVKATAKNRGNTHCRRVIKLLISFTLGTPVTVTFTIKRQAPGRKAGGRCVKPTKKNKSHKKCVRLIKLGKITRNGASGANSFTFNGKVGGKRLGPGTYVLEGSASAGGSSGPTRTIKLKLLP